MKKKNSKVVGILMISGLSVVLVGCLVFLYLILGTEVFFKKPANNVQVVDNETENDTNSKPDESTINPEDITDIEVSYNGGTLLAGAKANPSFFEVSAVHADGTKETVTNYSCAMLEDGYLLGQGTNTMIFKYAGKATAIEVTAIDPATCIYAPNYILGTVSAKSKDKADKLRNGEITYEEALSRVSFTGDSQIYALVSYKLLTTNTVEAEVGASADYLEKMFQNVVAKSYGKEAIVVHYGINSLSANAEERSRRIEQYKTLLLRLKEALPGTRIIVSCVFPVHSSITNQQPRFAYINEYDLNLLKMCIENDFEYYSNSEYLVAHQEMFSSDGLHLTPDFYKTYWVADLIETMGL